MAKRLARALGYIYIDTGAMYRAVTLFALRQTLLPDGHFDFPRLQALMPEVKVSFCLDEATGIPLTMLGDEVVEGAIRRMDVSQRVSEIAAQGFVRDAMTTQQRAMGANGGVVMDGRDIGTCVFPDAELKIFVTATPEVRAQRRFDEMKAKGEVADYEAILQNVQERDYADSHREIAPLRRADDAILLDNSHLTLAEQDAWLLAKAIEIIGAKSFF